MQPIFKPFNASIKKLILAGIFLLIISCSSVAVFLAPQKVKTTNRTEAALAADKLFWTIFHNGDYYALPQVIEKLTAAYLNDPQDSLTAAHIGFAHMWRISERKRLHAPDAKITDEIILARKYFEEAHLIDPSDARYLGFLAAANLVEAEIFHDEKMQRKGYFMMLKAIDSWPEFNLFTGGYLLSNQPANSKYFAQALAWQWQNLDKCIGKKIDRKNPNYAAYMKLEEADKKNRQKTVCWNSSIAPHNFEGFFLNMGDLLVKNSEPELAKIIYSNAKLSPNYRQWKFQSTLDKRIKEANKNVAKFNSNQSNQDLMVNSAYSCAACHQN